MSEQLAWQAERAEQGRLTPEASQRLLHELQVHQIELEVQNEEIMVARLEAEAAVERYADFYDFAPVGYLTLDADGVIRSANLTAATMLGVERGRLAGRHLESLVTQGRSQLRAIVRNVFKFRGKEVCDVKLHEGAEVAYVRVEATTCRSGLECRAVLIDVTVQHRAAEEIHLLNADLERRVLERTAALEASLKEQESFSYTVSHDLRAPLRNINGHLAIVKEDFPGELPPEVVGHLDRVRELTCHMGALIDNLLNLARIARTEVVRERLDLSEMSRGAVALLRESDPQREADFIIQDEIVVHGDRTLLRMVLVNLLENAWKYTSKVEHPRIEVASTLSSGKQVIRVTDNGVGFDMAFRDQLFGTFQRLHGPEYAGVGVGLATVKRIVERHGGEVWAESKVNGGSSFFFTLGG
ncbi:sensor histidine kinase [Geomonas sp.]|uniref:sensor histidine kinase n=1 Tax=Geomonas sp. TaxID=2651584 RepID=UPI002B476305|nr:ATP-binding protein [Geomonas sp.]HJV34562.1 ATP-binding protein [Geomonas sp.]